MLVVLHRGEGVIARAIQWQTRSVYSHASVLLEAAELVIEAREFQGVRIVPWAEVMASGERVDLFRVEGLTEEQEIAVREFLWDQIGKPYDYMMVARFISRRQEERTSSGKWFCSELVFAAFAQAGVRLLERIEPWAVSPGMLRLSLRLEQIKNEEFRMKKSVAPIGQHDWEWVEASSRLGGKAESGLRTPKGEQAGRLRYGKPEACATEEWTARRQAPTAKCGVHAGSTLEAVRSGVHSRWSMANRQGGACVC